MKLFFKSRSFWSILQLATMVTFVAACLLMLEDARAEQKLNQSRSRFRSGKPFLFLARGFKQDLFGIYPDRISQMFLGADGDVFVATCRFGMRDVYRFEADAEEFIVNATLVRMASPVFSESAPFCGQILNHSDGFAYEARRTYEVVQIDPKTALETGATYPTPDKVARLTSDPQTGGLFYLAENCASIATDECDVVALDTSTGTTTHFIGLGGNTFYRGFAFNPDGSELFLLVDRPRPSLVVVRRDADGLAGELERTIALHERALDIAFLDSGIAIITHTFAESTVFIPGPDEFSIFAAGGFTGASSILLQENCLYIAQDGTRFDDGTVVNVREGAVELASVVRICRPHWARKWRR